MAVKRPPTSAAGLALQRTHSQPSVICRLGGINFSIGWQDRDVVVKMIF